LPLIDARPPSADLIFRPGTTFVLQLTWPTGALAGRTFTSTLGDLPLDIQTADDALTITVTDEQSATLTTPAPWSLSELVVDDQEPIITGIWTPSDDPGMPGSFSATVVEGDLIVTIELVGSADQVAALAARVTTTESDIGDIEAADTAHLADDTAHGNPLGALATHEADTAAHGDPLGALTTHAADDTAHGDPLAAVAAQTTRAALESRGAQIDQTAAIAVRTRFLDFYRDAGSGAPTATWNNLGGDVTDAKHIASSDDVIWVGADWFDAGVGAVVNDLFTTTPLPQRSGAIIAPTPGTFAGATQLYASGASGVWLDAVVQAGLPAGTILWPIAVIDDANTIRVACWHVESPGANGEPHGRLIDSIIVTLHVFLGYTSHVACGFGALSDDFWVCGMWRDSDGFTYINGMQFVPSFDARTTGNPTAPNYVLDDPDNHYSLTRIARVANGSLNTVASWTFWDGSSWVAGVANAVPIEDIDGNPIRGDMGIRKVTTDRYSAVAHKLTDGHLDTYAATAPEGPYWPTARVPLPEMGRDIPGGRTVGQLCKILPPQVATPPRRCSIAMVSQNLIDPAVGYSVTPPWTEVSIDTFAPVFVAFPDY
jgi:hypothetical protein